MKLTLQKILLGLLVIPFAAAILYFLVGTPQAFSSAPSGLPANQLTATTTVVGPQETKTLFSANSVCTSRIIRTQGEPIFLLFADPTNGDLASTTMTSLAGFYQAASTTVAYDSGLYGCGRMTVEALASTTITSAQMF